MEHDIEVKCHLLRLFYSFLVAQINSVNFRTGGESQDWGKKTD